MVKSIKSKRDRYEFDTRVSHLQCMNRKDQLKLFLYSMSVDRKSRRGTDVSKNQGNSTESNTANGDQLSFRQGVSNLNWSGQTVTTYRLIDRIHSKSAEDLHQWHPKDETGALNMKLIRQSCLKQYYDAFRPKRNVWRNGRNSNKSNSADRFQNFIWWPNLKIENIWKMEYLDLG